MAVEVKLHPSLPATSSPLALCPAALHPSALHLPCPDQRVCCATNTTTLRLFTPPEAPSLFSLLSMPPHYSHYSHPKPAPLLFSRLFSPKAYSHYYHNSHPKPAPPVPHYSLYSHPKPDHYYSQYTHPNPAPILHPPPACPLTHLTLCMPLTTATRTSRAGPPSLGCRLRVASFTDFMPRTASSWGTRGRGRGRKEVGGLNAANELLQKCDHVKRECDRVL